MIVPFYAFRVGNIFQQETDHRVVSGADGFAQRGVAIAVGIVSIGQKQPASSLSDHPKGGIESAYLLQSTPPHHRAFQRRKE